MHATSKFAYSGLLVRRFYVPVMANLETELLRHSIYFYLLLAFRSGKSLRAIETDLRAYTKQINQMQIDKPLVFSKMLWQMAMNLM